VAGDVVVTGSAWLVMLLSAGVQSAAASLEGLAE